MGKQKKKHNQVEKTLKMPSHKRQEVNNLTDTLLKKCTEIGTNKEEWKDYEDIYCMVQKIRDIEKDYNVSLPNRDEKWNSFLSWCSDSGASYEAVDIKKLDDGEYGLVSKQLLNEGDTVLKVPKKLMMTTATVSESILGNFVKKDPILQHMPNVVLALHLMNEYINPDSFWKPYLSILPSEYNTVLYFTPEDLKELTGSPVKEECIKMYRNIARQYSYFYRQFQVCPELRSSSLRHYFTYDYYRSIDDIDLIPAALSERKSENAGILGPTHACLIAEQFIRIRNGDRFWYENKDIFTPDQLREIRKITLSRLLCDNSDNLLSIQKWALYPDSKRNPIVYCANSTDLPEINLQPWSSVIFYQ